MPEESDLRTAFRLLAEQAPEPGPLPSAPGNRPVRWPVLAATAAIIVVAVAIIALTRSSSSPTVGSAPPPSVSAHSSAAARPLSSSSVSSQTLSPGVLVTIPIDLVGKRFVDAQRELAAIGLSSQPDPVPGTAPSGVVTGLPSDLRTGRSVPAGTLVTLSVSDNSLFVVPPVINLSRSAAVAALRAAGWRGADAALAVTVQGVRDPALYGLVTAQSTAAGSVGDKTGPFPVTVAEKATVTVPTIRIGGSYDDAVAALRAAGVPFTDQAVPATTAAQSGTVASISVPAGTVIPWDQTLVLVEYIVYTPASTSR